MTDSFVPAEVIKERFDHLVSVQNQITYERHLESVGETMEVLSEGPSRKREDVATTRSRTGKLVHVPGVIRSGEFLDVRIDQARHHHLVGSPV
jgi:tRNA-2-methylthio-N6-dimethylallyladenosine synthase